MEIKNVKKVALGLAVALAMAGTAQAQIPVTDGASIANNRMEHVENIAKYVEQIGQLKQQYEQMQQQYSALTGSRNLGEIFNDSALRDYLPSDWQKVYDSVRSGGYGGLSSSGKSIYDQNKVYDACASVTDSTQKSACEAAAVKPSQDKAFASDAFDSAEKRLGQIDSLMGQINQTPDPKAIAELQGRIATEQAAIANEQTKLQLYSMMAQAEDKIQQQRQHEINAKALSRRGQLDLEPMTFN